MEILLVEDSLDDAELTIRELKRLLYGQKRWLDLVHLLSEDAARTEDREAQSLMLYQAARIQGDRLGNVDAAIPLLERAHAAYKMTVEHEAWTSSQRWNRGQRRATGAMTTNRRKSSSGTSTADCSAKIRISFRELANGRYSGSAFVPYVVRPWCS